MLLTLSRLHDLRDARRHHLAIDELTIGGVAGVTRGSHSNHVSSSKTSAAPVARA